MTLRHRAHIDNGGDHGSDPRSVAYLIRPRAKKPSNARTTMMMMIHRMMLKTHPLLSRHVRSVHSTVKAAVLPVSGRECVRRSGSVRGSRDRRER